MRKKWKFNNFTGITTGFRKGDKVEIAIEGPMKGAMWFWRGEIPLIREDKERIYFPKIKISNRKLHEIMILLAQILGFEGVEFVRVEQTGRRKSCIFKFL